MKSVTRSEGYGKKKKEEAQKEQRKELWRDQVNLPFHVHVPTTYIFEVKKGSFFKTSQLLSLVPV